MGVWSSGRANGVHPWRAVRHIDKSTRVYIGYFKTQEEAAIAYDAFMIADWRFSWAPGDPRLQTREQFSRPLPGDQARGGGGALQQRPPMRAPAPRGSFDFGGVEGPSPDNDDGAASDEDVRARGLSQAARVVYAEVGALSGGRRIGSPATCSLDDGGACDKQLRSPSCPRPKSAREL